MSFSSKNKIIDAYAVGLSLTFEHRADLPNSQTPQAGELTEGQLEEEERNAAEHQHDEVR